MGWPIYVFMGRARYHSAATAEVSESPLQPIVIGRVSIILTWLASSFYGRSFQRLVLSLIAQNKIDTPAN